MKRKILLGLTTTPKSDWRKKTREINKFSIKEVALFPTYLGLSDRKELYELLEETCVEEIPHVHLRDDMESWELGYFYKKYKTRLFNIHHRETDFELLKQNLKYVKNIFVENFDKIDESFVKAAKNCGGICFDISHCEDMTELNGKKESQKLFDLIEAYKVGCCHISAVLPEAHEVKSMRTGKQVKILSEHFLSSMSELDYVKRYVDYLPQTVSMELENSFEEQIEIRKYLEKIIK